MSAPSDWISVKDRLPEANQPFWAHMQNDTFPIAIMPGGVALPRDYFYCHQEITHWMPATLPEPPKSECEIELDAAWYAHVGLNLYSPSEQANFKAGFLAGWQAHEKRGEKERNYPPL